MVALFLQHNCSTISVIEMYTNFSSVFQDKPRSRPAFLGTRPGGHHQRSAGIAHVRARGLECRDETKTHEDVASALDSTRFSLDTAELKGLCTRSK